MANKYLYSGAAGTADGSSWTNAYTTMTAACAGMAAGDTCFVADDHSESTAGAVTLAPPGTYANPNRFICARRSGGSVPPVSADLRTTGSVATTGANAINFGGGVAYCRGIVFSCGSGSSNASITIASAAGAEWSFDNCNLKLNNTAAGARILAGPTASATAVGRTFLSNTTLTFGNASQGVALRMSNLEMVGGAIAGTAPTTLFASNDTHMGFTHLRDVDLSALGSGKTLCAAFTMPQRMVFERCKLGASVTIAAAQNIPGVSIDIVNCDSGATNYRNERYAYQGILTTETVVVASGADTDGTTPFSHKIVTSANDNVPFAFGSFPMGDFYAGGTGSAVSLTYELLTDNVTLTNADAWIELEYLGSSATPLGSIASSGPADPLAASSNLASSSASWTTTGLTTPLAQKIAVSFTPQMKGMYRAVLKVAKASTTIWLSPPVAEAA